MHAATISDRTAQVKRLPVDGSTTDTLFNDSNKIIQSLKLIRKLWVTSDISLQECRYENKNSENGSRKRL